MRIKVMTPQERERHLKKGPRSMMYRRNLRGSWEFFNHHHWMRSVFGQSRTGPGYGHIILQYEDTWCEPVGWIDFQ